jgi:hypothetical protein
MSTVRGPDVICLWGAGNAVLLGILIGYGDWVMPIALYAGSVLVIELVGIVFWFTYLTRLPQASHVPAPRRTNSALMAALVAGFVGIGLVYKGWMATPAAFPALALLSEYLGWLWHRYESPEPNRSRVAGQSR